MSILILICIFSSEKSFSQKETTWDFYIGTGIINKLTYNHEGISPKARDFQRPSIVIGIGRSYNRHNIIAEYTNFGTLNASYNYTELKSNSSGLAGAFFGLLVAPSLDSYLNVVLSSAPHSYHSNTSGDLTVNATQTSFKYYYNILDRNSMNIFIGTGLGIIQYDIEGKIKISERSESKVEIISKRRIRPTGQLFAGINYRIYNNFLIESRFGYSKLPVEIGIKYQL